VRITTVYSGLHGFVKGKTLRKFGNAENHSDSSLNCAKYPRLETEVIVNCVAEELQSRESVRHSRKVYTELHSDDDVEFKAVFVARHGLSCKSVTSVGQKIPRVGSKFS
jgi:hypothetical protein